MCDPHWLGRMVRLGLFGIAVMTLLVTVILLARGTTVQDWNTAGELTLVEVMLFVGFDERERVAYHRKFGDTWNIPPRTDLCIELYSGLTTSCPEYWISFPRSGMSAARQSWGRGRRGGFFQGGRRHRGGAG